MCFKNILLFIFSSIFLEISVVLTKQKQTHWVIVKSRSHFTMFLQAIGEQPSARVVNAIEANTSKSVLDWHSNNLCSESVKSIKIWALSFLACSETVVYCNDSVYTLSKVFFFTIYIFLEKWITLLVITDCHLEFVKYVTFSVTSLKMTQMWHKITFLKTVVVSLLCQERDR